MFTTPHKSPPAAGATALPVPRAQRLPLRSACAAALIAILVVVSPGLTGVQSAGAHRATATCAPAQTKVGAYASAVRAAGPLGYWRLDDTCKGTVTDSSGNNHNGTAVGGVTSNQPGVPLRDDSDTAMAFDGSTGYINLGNTTALQPTRLTVEAWVNTTVARGFTEPIVESGGYELSLDGAGRPFFRINTSDVTTQTQSSLLPVIDGGWHYLVGTFDGSQICLYQDGGPVGCQAASTIFYFPRVPSLIAWNDLTTILFMGRIDEVAIYPTALSANQVLSHRLAAQQPTTIALAASQGTTVTGQPFTLIASVGSPAGAVTSGAVILYEDGVEEFSAGLGGSSSVIFHAGLGSPATEIIGTHIFTATYDSSFSPPYASSTSAPVSHTLNSGLTATTLTTSANPAVAGQAVTLTANTAAVSPAAGSTYPGTVTFRDGATVLGSVTVDTTGRAALTLSSLTAGTHAITAVYSSSVRLGFGTEFQSSTSATLSQVVNQVPTATTLTSNNSPSSQGAPVTFSAAVRVVAPGIGTPTGTVMFVDGTSVLGTGTLANGVATFTTTRLSSGVHKIMAVYVGGSFAGSMSSILTQIVIQHS